MEPESRKQEGRVDRYGASETPYVPKLGAALVTLEGERTLLVVR
jgi:hypothetical protein